jgi:hypothetical protein
LGFSSRQTALFGPGDREIIDLPNHLEQLVRVLGRGHREGAFLATDRTAGREGTDRRLGSVPHKLRNGITAGRPVPHEEFREAFHLFVDAHPRSLSRSLFALKRSPADNAVWSMNLLPRHRHVMPWIEDELKRLGANYVQGGLWRGFAIRDGNLIIGQQNFSGGETAELVFCPRVDIFRSQRRTARRAETYGVCSDS